MNLFVDNWVNIDNISDETFEKPSKEDLDNLNVGFSVKISNNKERFWIEIVKIQDYYIIGKIDNNLIFNEKYDNNDLVLIEKKNIIDIHDFEFKKIMLKYTKVKNKNKSSDKVKK